MGFQRTIPSDISPRTVTVYKVAIYNGVNNEVIISQRYATEIGAEIMNSRVISNTAFQISIGDLENGEEWTSKG